MTVIKRMALGIFPFAILVLLIAFETQAAYRLQRVAVDPAGGGDATLSPDGKRFVISSKRSGHWDLWMFDLSASTWTQLTHHKADDFEARWSPDGKRIAFTSTRAGQKDIWTMDLETRALKQLTVSEHEDEYPAWSPDGKDIVYTSGPWKARAFFITPAQGGRPRQISRQLGQVGACTFDPQGNSLVCHRYDLGSGDLIRVWLNDGEITPLTIGDAWDYKPTASPNGKWIAFSRSEEGPSHIWLLPTAGGRARQLTRAPYDDRWPTWSADGDRLFFHRIVDRGMALKMLDRRSGKVRTLVGAEERPLQASMDPQARRVVYCSQVEHRKILKILDLDTGAIRTLDTGPGEACFPRWSPDGAHIAFVGKPGKRWEVSIIRPDSSERVWLTAGLPGLRGMNGPIDWSPDSTKLLFHADTDPFEARLYTIDLKTRQLRTVTGEGWFDEAPSWVSDGNEIVFMSTRGGDWTWGLFRLSLSNGEMQTIAGPDWVQKNFPRTSAHGDIIWSMYDDRGNQMLAEQLSIGGRHILTEAGAGARWPSYSSDAKSILFTSIERQVEYWMAQDLFTSGSPILKTSQMFQPRHSFDFTKIQSESGIFGFGRSPVDLHRR